MKNLILVLVLVLAGCHSNSCTPTHHRSANKIHQVKLQKLTTRDGEQARYAYQDNGLWYYYVLLSTTNTTSNTSVSYPSNQPSYDFTRLDAPGKVSVPTGGTWTKSSTPPAKEEVEHLEEIQIEEQPSGEPTTDQQFTQEDLQPEDHFFGNENTTETHETTTTSEPSTDTGSSDTGGGFGDSGGGGGFDSGGGSFD